MLIGSRAIKAHFQTTFDRKLRDYDLIGTPEQVVALFNKLKSRVAKFRITESKRKIMLWLKNNYVVEVEIAEPNSSALAFLQANAKQNKIRVADLYDHECILPSLQTLSLIKLSHLRLPINWKKHIEDYHFLKMRMMDAATNEELAAYRLRRIETDNRKRKPNLAKTNEDFFAASEKKVKRFYHHDDLHAATCFYQQPLFNIIKKDQGKALVSFELFKDLPKMTQIKLVQEECFAIALERVIIPALVEGKDYDANEAFRYALKRICTTLTGGWFREFAIENYPEMFKHNVDYVEKFTKALASGKIRRLKDDSACKQAVG